MTERVIAIDGPAGSGKSTTASTVAARLGFSHVDSGALYRAVTLAVLDAAIELRGQLVVALAQSLPVRLRHTDTGFKPEVAGVDVSEEIRSDRVTALVSPVSALPEVRDWVNAELRACARIDPRGVVVDGRDIGSVVFPEAPLKVYLTATAAERAKRRLIQRGGTVEDAAIQATAADITRRDAHDSKRAVAPLIVAQDALVIDTTGMTFDEQVDRIMELAAEAFGSLDTVS